MRKRDGHNLGRRGWCWCCFLTTAASHIPEHSAGVEVDAEVEVLNENSISEETRERVRGLPRQERFRALDLFFCGGKRNSSSSDESANSNGSEESSSTWNILVFIRIFINGMVLQHLKKSQKKVVPELVRGEDREAGGNGAIEQRLPPVPWRFMIEWSAISKRLEQQTSHRVQKIGDGAPRTKPL